MSYHADEFNITISKLLFHDQLMKITNKPLDNRGLFSARPNQNFPRSCFVG